MKKTLFIVFVFLFNNAFSEIQKSIVNSEIKEVKVYQSGAQIIRNINATVEQGVTQLSSEGLSQYINTSSITVTGTGDVTLLSIVTELNYINDTKKSPRLKSLQDSLDELNHSLDKLNDLSAVFLGEIEMLNANKSIGGANVGVDKDNLKEIADFYRERMIELKIKLLDNKNESKKLNENIKKVSEQISLLFAEESKPTNTVIITVEAKQKTNLSMELSYAVTHAGWIPLYDIRATDITSNIQLSYKANVFQSTGEDWKNVKLTLSTGNPSISGVEPTLNPWYLNFYQPAPASLSNNLGNQINMRGARSEGTAYYVDGAKMTSGAEFVTMEENQLTTDFNIALPYSIPSNDKKHLVDIQTYSLPAVYMYSAVPKLDRDAFLLARISGWDELNLLNGEANVYFEGSFVGTSRIDTRSTKDTLDVSLGRDKKITITRVKEKDLSSSKFLGSNTVKELNYLITIRNGKKDAIKIDIMDQVPVAKNSDIDVKTIDLDGGEYNAETGMVKWHMDIAPGSTVTHKLGFSVKYPKNKVIEGL